MGTITGQSLADRAAALVHDVSKVRWTDTNWLRWLNDGQREAVLAKPEINTTNISVQLTAGMSKQTLPSDAVALIDVVRDMGADGSTPGKAVRIVSKEAMDQAIPDWHTSIGNGYVTNYVYDPRDPKTYYVYPNPGSPRYVELRYAQLPADLTSLSDSINIDDVYANALLNYMLFRAYSMDSVYADHINESQAYYQLFLSAIGVTTSNELRDNPNRTTGPYSESSHAAAAKPA